MANSTSPRRNATDGKQPFASGEDHFSGLEADAAVRLAMASGDLVLVLSAEGRILDLSADRREFPEADGWVGRDWLDTVTVESKPKIMEMLAALRKGGAPHWRHINLTTGEGDVPVRFAAVSLGGTGRSIAFGRHLRAEADLQKRLLQAQQSLERDYLRLRQLESRYRLLFEHSPEPVLIVEAGTFRIREVNQAAHPVFGARPGTLHGTRFASLFEKSVRDAVVAFLGSALVSQNLQPLPVTLAEGDGQFLLSAEGFRERGGQLLLVRVLNANASAPRAGELTARMVESMPDGFVLTDAAMVIREANPAFIELVGAATADQLRGRGLGDFVGRPGIDLELIETQLAKYDSARNVSTVVRAGEGFEGEPVELSAVRTGLDEVCYGFVIRPISRRLRDLPPSGDSPRSVEQLTELVGRMSLRDIVRESTDLIERLCIEAALEYTSNNRASAAEILGLSRQGLYSKLHRYGLGNLTDAED